jgi:tetratricopeptide (TPR) repeat protein
MPNFVCKNYGSCSKADSRETIELPPGSEPVCPECGFKLESLDDKIGPASGSRRTVIAGLASAAVIVVAVTGWMWMSPSKKAKAPAESASATTVTPASKGMSPNAADQAKAKQAVDGKILDAGGSGALPDQRAVIAREYVKAAIPLLQAGKWQEADAQLLKAKNENPDEPLIYVNQAIIHLKQTRDKEALTDLETAFKKGFKDFGAIEGDVDLKPLTVKPEYAAMVAPYKTK